MTETEAMATQPLTAYLSQVKVTQSQAIAMLSTLANANFDKDPTLYASLNDAISALSSAETKPAEETVAEPGSMQPPDVVREDPNAGPQTVTASEQAKEEPVVPEGPIPPS